MRAVVLIAVALVAVGVFIAWRLGFMGASAYVRNHEMQLPDAESRFFSPVTVHDGLAVYRVGTSVESDREPGTRGAGGSEGEPGATPRVVAAGDGAVAEGAAAEGAARFSIDRGEGRTPVLLFPYPHSDASVPMAQSEIAEVFISIGRDVLSFDAPGAFRSTRDPVGDMAEMIRCAAEALELLDVEGPVIAAGHSMGGLCALAFALEHPNRVDSLILISSLSGFPAAAKWGYPGTKWKITQPEYWRVVRQGLRITNGRGSLADMKSCMNFLGRNMFHDPALFVPWEIEPRDYETPIPIRATWPKNMWKRVDYSGRLGEIDIPTLVTAGRHDPETALPCALELHRGIDGAQLVVFEKSGHCSFVEEPARFAEVLEGFVSSRP